MRALVSLSSDTLFSGLVLSLSAEAAISLLSICAIALLPSKRKISSGSWMYFFVSLSIGCLIGDSAFHLIPEVSPTVECGVSMVVGIYTMLIVRQISQGHEHQHEHDQHLLNGEGCSPEFKTAKTSVILGDILHNLVDGIAVGSSFLVSTRLGATTAIAIAFHEIPHEIADFVVLLAGGMPRRQAIKTCILTNCSGIVGVAISGGLLIWTPKVAGQKTVVDCILSFTAGTFLSVALCDLLPQVLGALHTSRAARTAMAMHGGFLIGIALMGAIKVFYE